MSIPIIGIMPKDFLHHPICTNLPCSLPGTYCSADNDAAGC